MPFSRSRSIESITRSATVSLSRKAPDCHSMASTSVVLPWSTWAMMAMLRRSSRRTVMLPRKSGCPDRHRHLRVPVASPTGLSQGRPIDYTKRPENARVGVIPKVGVRPGGTGERLLLVVALERHRVPAVVEPHGEEVEERPPHEAVGVHHAARADRRHVDRGE